jgi:hypothetical protein
MDMGKSDHVLSKEEEMKQNEANGSVTKTTNLFQQNSQKKVNALNKLNQELSD